jgi:cytochrome P450
MTYDSRYAHLHDSRYAHLAEHFDIEDPVFATDFEGALEWLVRSCPVAHSTVGPGYLALNRYADVRRCGQDWRGFSSADGWMLNPPEGNIPILPEDLDPPYHTQWRRALNPFFKPDHVDTLESHARVYAAELVSGFAARGRCEYISEFAVQLPGLVLFRHLLIVPVEVLPVLFRDIEAYSFGPVQERAAAFGRVYAYLEQLLTERAGTPGDDLIGVILAGVEDERGQPCSWADKVHTALDVVFGGLATTTHAMAGAILELARHPELRHAALDDAALLDGIVEETVRLYAPVVAVGRTVKSDTQIAGMQLHAGDRIALNFAAASRDPDVCSDPGRFDPTRKEIVHTAFGVGPHRCLGEHLARLEIRVAVQEMLKQVPDFHLVEGAAPTYDSGQLRTMTRLELAWP